MNDNDETTPPATAGWTVNVRGPLRLDHDGTPVDLRPKERSVLAALVVSHPVPADTDRIASLIWGHAVPGSAHKSIQNHIARIRRAAGDAVMTEATGYTLAPSVVIDDSTATAGAAVLPDLADTPEVEAQRERIRSRILTDDERALEIAVAGGLDGDVIQRLHAAVIDEPYREQRWVLLVTAQYTLGDRRQALLTCHAARRHLAEVGLPPGDRLVDLERTILGSDSDGPDADDPSTIGRPTLHPHFDEPFVGRTDALAHLHEAWDAVATQRRPALVILKGRAGIGKTRLADRFCHEVFERNAATRLVWGRHRSSGGRSSGALIEALLRLLASEPELAAEHAATERTIRLAAGRTGDAADLDDGRDLRRAVVELTRTIARQPTIWFVDDLQWASTDSLALLEEALDGATGPILVIATSRPTDLGNDAAIGALERIVPTRTIWLDPLTVDDVEALIERPDMPADRRLAEVVHDRTGGLSLYVSEIARAARRHGSPIDPANIPTAIREWVTHRIRALPPADAGLLRLAAVIGRHVDPALLEACSPYDPGEVTARCDELVSDGFLTVGDTVSTLQFSHAITRDIVLDGIGPLERARLHRHIGQTMIERADAGAPEHARIAHHLSRAGEPCSEAAAEHAAAAAEQELSDGAWQRASELFRVAVDAARTPGTRGRSLVGLGRALVCLERFDDAAVALQEARLSAIADDLPMIEGASALALSGRAGRGAASGSGGSSIDDALRQAIEHLSGTRGREAAILLSDLERELAFSLLLSDDAAERCELLTRSLTRMRVLDPPSPRPLAAALLGERYAQLDPPAVESRLANIAEVLAMPRRQVGSETLIAAHCYRHEDLIRTGDLAGASRALDAASEIADRYPEPYWRWVITTWRYLRALHAGDLDGAEELAHAAASTRRTVAEAQACLAVNLVNIRLYQGRPGEMMPTLAGAVERHPEIPAYRAVLAFCAAEAGDLDQADDTLRWFDRTGYANLPTDTNRFLALALLGHVAATVRNEAAGRSLRVLLEPYRAHWVVLACYGGGGASWGPTAHVLARLADLAGDRSTAEAEFERALAEAHAAPPALARIEQDRLRFTEPAAATTTARQQC